jgi:hypothetical protein
MADYYKTLWTYWMDEMDGNAALKNDAVIKNNFMNGGFYRYDVSNEVSVLVMNTMYYLIDNDQTPEGQVPQGQFSWLRSQLELSAGTNRKFILAFHVYGGARYKNADMWTEDMTREYFEIVRDHADQIIIEVGAHDHYGMLRYHTSNYVMDLPNPSTKFYFHNLLVAPGVTPNKDQNPGITMFEVDNGIPHSLKQEFLDLNPTFGHTSVPANLTWYSIDYASRYGLTQLDAESLSNLRQNLEADLDLAHDYMVRTMGFDPTKSSEYQQAMNIYMDKNLITSKGNPLGFFCEMHKSIDGVEETACNSGNFADLDLFLQ